MLIGQITITISLCLYLIFFVPQLLLTQQQKNTQGLSLGMHGFLCVGYISDLMYGFGCQMQWQYKLVSITGLICLLLQHIQFYRYGLKNKTEKQFYFLLTFLSLAWVLYLIFIAVSQKPSRGFYDGIGFIAILCWTLCMLPQIIQNAVKKSTLGLSLSFVILSFIIKICDIISAWTFNWDYPSKIGAVVFLFGSIILLFQVMYYARKSTSKTLVAYC